MVVLIKLKKSFVIGRQAGIITINVWLLFSEGIINVINVLMLYESCR